MLQYVVPFVIALVVSYALTPSVKKLAIKIGAVDRPNARKVHTHVIPRLGGLAIYIGFMAAVLFCVPLQHELVGMLLGCTVIVAVGNAPTALLRLRELIDVGKMKPALIIGVPVGFVNVVYAKETIMEAGIPYIVAKGRKGGSTIAAAICNALIYRLTRG